MGRRVRVTLLACFLLAGTFLFVRSLHVWGKQTEARELEAQVEQLLEERRKVWEAVEDPFGEDGKLTVLLIGLDNRPSQTMGHCDMIQFLEIDRQAESVTITAVPRGTYAPLPPGEHEPSDYYVSNACGIAGLSYGIQEIERIAGKKAEALVTVGFAESLGAFRLLGLPATDTLQWLRHRQGYAVGEPQRARNHSTFLKTTLVRFVPLSSDSATLPVQYLLYRIVHTDLSFAQARGVLTALLEMHLPEHAERITLAMTPSHEVSDIPYDPTHVKEELEALLDPIKDRLPSYTGTSKEELDAKLARVLEEGMADPVFVASAFERKLWLQLDDLEMRERLHYRTLAAFLSSVEDTETEHVLLAEYVVEMEALGETAWATAGRDMLTALLSQNLPESP